MRPSSSCSHRPCSEGGRNSLASPGCTVCTGVEWPCLSVLPASRPCWRPSHCYCWWCQPHLHDIGHCSERSGEGCARCSHCWRQRLALWYLRTTPVALFESSPGCHILCQLLLPMDLVHVEKDGLPRCRSHRHAGEGAQVHHLQLAISHANTCADTHLWPRRSGKERHCYG
jgi:hypothetical protein